LSGSEAIHPGYGFLSENYRLYDACKKNNLVFVGPNGKCIKLMGNKVEARVYMEKQGIPMLKGASGTIEEIYNRLDELKFPVLVKAAAGGGGKGMRIVREKSQFRDAVESTSREALSYFGDTTVFVETFVENPRHIEVQILGDKHGNVIHLFERECTIQRRYQKIIEESPSLTLSQAQRENICRTAVKIASSIGYDNAGTIEFIVDEVLNHYFLEMNTRIQVEHPITEMVTGIDLVEEQILIAAGNPLSHQQSDIKPSGHAIECRVYAEDPAEHFRPSPGRMTYYNEPDYEFVRLDSAQKEKTIIEPYFDPMISKLVVLGKDREDAIRKACLAVEDYSVHGIRTNLPYLYELLNHPAFQNNQITTTFCDTHTEELISGIEHKQNEIPIQIPLISACLYSFTAQMNTLNIWERFGYWRNEMQISIRMGDTVYELEILKNTSSALIIKIKNNLHTINEFKNSGAVLKYLLDGKYVQVTVSDNQKGDICVAYGPYQFHLNRTDILIPQETAGQYTRSMHSDGHLYSPMPGKIIKVNITPGQKVMKGDVLMIVEAMKMENHIVAPNEGEIEEINVNVGDSVETKTQLLIFKSQNNEL
jgi:3-methylcrotonyl-CoA carboxylase alpha subunit